MRARAPTCPGSRLRSCGAPRQRSPHARVRSCIVASGCACVRAAPETFDHSRHKARQRHRHRLSAHHQGARPLRGIAKAFSERRAEDGAAWRRAVRVRRGARSDALATNGRAGTITRRGDRILGHATRYNGLRGREHGGSANNRRRHLEVGIRLFQMLAEAEPRLGRRPLPRAYTCVRQNERRDAHAVRSARGRAMK